MTGTQCRLSDCALVTIRAPWPLVVSRCRPTRAAALGKPDRVRLTITLDKHVTLAAGRNVSWKATFTAMSATCKDTLHLHGGQEIYNAEACVMLLACSAFAWSYISATSLGRSQLEACPMPTRQRGLQKSTDSPARHH